MSPLGTTSRRALTVVGLLPALFWVVYSLSNVVLVAPPAIGPVTAVNLIYVAMVPAAVLALGDWRARLVPGIGAYAAFLGWVLLSLVWHGAAPGVQVPKQIVIYGLLGLTIAQLTVGAAWGLRALGGAVMLVAVLLSGWTIAYALSTGFAYRAGVPINPNLPATLIGAGLVTAAAYYLDGPARRWRVLSMALVSLYGCLLLGSRGVLLGLVAAAATVWWRDRPSLRSSQGLLAGSVAVAVLSLVPAVPHGLWQAGLHAAHRVQQAARSVEATGQGTAFEPGFGSSVRSSAERVPAPLDPRATESTAIGRFGEEEVASLNLRSDLWWAGLRYLGSGTSALLVGGGLGNSQVVAHDANPVFSNMHNVALQVATDFGLIGLALFGWLHWRILMALWSAPGRFARAGVACLTFWVVVGVTATVADLHVYWVGLGAAAVAARQAAPARRG